MTEKELLYVEDILEQSSQLKEVVTYFKSMVNDNDLLDVLDDIEKINNKQYKGICGLL